MDITGWWRDHCEMERDGMPLEMWLDDKGIGACYWVRHVLYMYFLYDIRELDRIRRILRVRPWKKKTPDPAIRLLELLNSSNVDLCAASTG